MPKDKTSNDNSKTAKGTSQSDVEEKFKEIFGRYPQSSPVAQSTSQEDVEKKFEGLTGRPPGRFPKDMPLEERVSEIGRENKALQAQKSQGLEDKMKNVAELSQKLKSQKGRVVEEARQNLKRLDGQLERDDIVLGKKVTEPHSGKKSQEAANTPRKATAEGKNFEQGTKTTEASVQTDVQQPPQKNAAETSSVDKPQTAGKKTAEQTKEDSTPQPQENQKEEGIWSMLKRLVKKVLEKLLGDEENIENTYEETPQRNTPQQRSQQQSPYQRGNEKNTQAPQRNTPNNEVQQSKTSSINVNGEEFNLEPGKAFNYQNKALNIDIRVSYPSPEATQQANPEAKQQAANASTSMKLNINGKEFNLKPGESFNHKSPGLEVSVTHGHQQSQQQNPNYGKILEQYPDATKGLEQVGKPEQVTGSNAPSNTPTANEVNTGHGR